MIGVQAIVPRGETKELRSQSQSQPMWSITSTAKATCLKLAPNQSHPKRLCLHVPQTSWGNFPLCLGSAPPIVSVSLSITSSQTAFQPLKIVVVISVVVVLLEVFVTQKDH
jgi:hypothetical protein